MSRYEHIAKGPSPIIMRHRKIETKDGSFHTLSRIQDSGVDYSKRNNHIAHHVAFEEREIRHLPDPATILLHWRGWRSEWQEPPRILGETDEFNIHDMDTSHINEPEDSDFPHMVENGIPLVRFVPIETGFELVVTAHWRKALLQLPVADRWKCSFTNCLLSTDKPSEFAWAAYWQDRELPFDIPQEPRPLGVTETPSEEVATEAIEAEEPIEIPTATPEPKRQAPIVEIPDEENFKKAKRSKKPWTRRRMSHFLNTSLVALSILSLATAIFFLIEYRNNRRQAALDQGRQNAVLIKDDSDAGSQASNLSVSAARVEWDRLLAESALFDDLPLARAAAETLRVSGDPQPEDTLAFLEDALDQVTSSSSSSVDVPSRFLTKTETNVALEPKVGRLLETKNLYLASETLKTALSRLKELSVDVSMIEERLSQNAFRWEDLLIGLKECRRRTRDQFGSFDISRQNVASQYDETYRELVSDNRLEPYLELHDIFGRRQSSGFMAIDKSGYVSEPREIYYASFMQRIFNEFVLPRYSHFNQSPEFQMALRHAGSEKLTTALEVAKAIQDALEKARVQDVELQAQINFIKAQWENLFERNDLMEEAIIAFSIERIEEAKSKLSRLQTQLEPDDLKNYRRIRDINRVIDEAEKALQESETNEEWVVIHVQSSQLLESAQ